jgi:hypothetical protein
MTEWAVVIPEERYEDERLFRHDTLDLPGLRGPAPGDEVLLVVGEIGWGAQAGGGPHVVGLGRVRAEEPVVVEYTRRLFDNPQPADQITLEGALTKLDPAAYRAVTDRISPRPEIATWLVSVDLPIEADSPAEAVRQFWTYVMELGPSELPAFVWPSGRELAMQAYVLGVEANLDPEEDDDESTQGEAGG